MGSSARYHTASLIAVFLALAESASSIGAESAATPCNTRDLGTASVGNLQDHARVPKRT